MWEWFKKSGFKSPESETDNPYTFMMNTNGLSMLDFMAANPERGARFNAAMQSQSVAGSWAISIFPWEEELKKLNTSDDTVLVVDVGGGKGHVTAEIKRLIGPNVKGRLVLEDKPAVLAEIIEPLDGIEKIGYDFFTPNPIKGTPICSLSAALTEGKI